MCVYRDPAMDLIIDAKAAWTSPLLPTADELAQRYSVASGYPLEHWGFYMALGYFKLAVIAAGIDFRIRMAALTKPEANPQGDANQVGASVAPMIASGLAALR